MDAIWKVHKLFIDKQVDAGKRSIRFGEHEMGGMETKRFHYHKETWFDDYVINEVQGMQQR